MTIRINHQKVHPQIFKTMMKLETLITESGLDPTLYSLIKMRASQINGCSFCIDMHAKELQKKGESLDRILLLTVWREVSNYTDEEKAVLELTECVTRVAEEGVPDHVYKNVLQYYSEKEFLTIIMAINTINSWNRLGISTGMFPGCFL
ncbi:carboxymuconolactone decarboxylase family protein [Halalkalibacter sp. APA_J-10(15)]|uniref:carboxymuconolactone decarboxylase family protein n=1 Tax=unclassified Halalkalibacter TaxID=2893063 RepID=UPI001FF1D202|nr:carboxymuconolactone decarboxylase family protein [Halalkalibacter sp. APA_J-10(15)]MCK0471705.1 carboxymuconolactone decarboxylase family protein [Halalkalibacter sp. APA_J-10(15)]